MSGDDLKNVQRDQALRIPASAYNAFIDAAADYRRRTIGIEGQYKQRDSRSGVVIVRNQSGAALGQSAVVELGSVIIGHLSNFWKSFVHARLAVPMGDRGCLSLFGRDAEAHRLLAEHLTAEYRVKTEGRGRVVDEWRMRPEAQDNHWLDGLVGCTVAASIQGAILPGTDAKVAPKTGPMKLSALQKGRRQ